ncbi:MAG: hypothetical protein E7019_00720 [Alphaproteobacteria bacterium]|nr:hypothetical protein [Alphaproteobacteria bacterium]
MITFKNILPLAILGFFISACSTIFPQTEDELPEYTEPRYNTEEPIQLSVNKINIVSEFTPTFTRPHVEHLFPVSIEKSAKLWAQDRLKAADYSSRKVAEVVIKDAGVTEEIEKGDNQIFNNDRIRYRANLIITIRITDLDNMSQASTNVEAWRELAIPADTDIAEKEQYWHGMVNKLFDEFNIKMSDNIYKSLNMYVINKPITPTYY